MPDHTGSLKSYSVLTLLPCILLHTHSALIPNSGYYPINGTLTINSWQLTLEVPSHQGWETQNCEPVPREPLFCLAVVRLSLFCLPEPSYSTVRHESSPGDPTQALSTFWTPEKLSDF